MPSSIFERDNEWQLALATKFLDPFYRSCGWSIWRYPGDHPVQRQHVDASVLTRAGAVYYIDEKIIRGRRDGQKAEKVSLETWSCSVPGRKKFGWNHHKERNDATILLICFADTADLQADSWKKVACLDCVWMPFLPLRDWFWQQGEDRWERQDNGQANHSISRKVPINEIVAAIPGVRRFLINEASIAQAAA